MKQGTIAFGLIWLLVSTNAAAETYQVTITNEMDREFLAPVLVTSASYDQHIFVEDYVTAQAEEQILTGDPANLAERIGEAGGNAFVIRSNKGAASGSLPPGSSITFEMTTDAKKVRVLAMVVPTLVPDNYVTGVIELDDTRRIAFGDLGRWDIGHDEGRRSVEELDSDQVAKIVIVTK